MDWLTSEVKDTVLGYKLRVEFKERVNLIRGDSGVGKTALYNYFDRQSYDNDKICCINSIQARKFKLNDGLLELLKTKRECIIVIDNTDVILLDKDRMHIQYDYNNRYVLFGRNSRGLPITDVNVADLVRDDRNKIIYTNYKFKGVELNDRNMDRGQHSWLQIY